MNQKYDFKKDSIIAQLYPTPNPLLWQIAKVRSLNFNLGNIKDSQIAHEYVDSIKQIFTEPFLASEAERVLEKTHPKDRARSYQLPIYAKNIKIIRSFNSSISQVRKIRPRKTTKNI